MLPHPPRGLSRSFERRTVRLAEDRKHPSERSGAICRVRWSGEVSGARPRHVRIGTVSRFSGLQRSPQNIKMVAKHVRLYREVDEDVDLVQQELAAATEVFAVPMP